MEGYEYHLIKLSSLNVRMIKTLSEEFRRKPDGSDDYILMYGNSALKEEERNDRANRSMYDNV